MTKIADTRQNVAAQNRISVRQSACKFFVPSIIDDIENINQTSTKTLIIEQLIQLHVTQDRQSRPVECKATTTLQLLSN